MNTLTKRVLLTTAILSVLGVMLLAIGIVTGGLSFLGSRRRRLSALPALSRDSCIRKRRCPLMTFPLSILM